MRAVLLTGSHPRHAYMARSLAESGCLVGLVIERRESMVPDPAVNLGPATRSLFIKHFRSRAETEEEFFGAAKLPETVTKEVELEQLNHPETAEFINRLAPDLLLSYGIHKLTSATLEAVKCNFKWNIHGGLSPWYRGVVTHFWPSYCLEPQMTGMTVHELTQDIDGGGVIHQSAAQLVPGDGLHQLACRAVMSLGGELAPLMVALGAERLKAPHKQGTTGRIWRSVDWQPAHLHVIYDYYQNRIVDRYLDGAFSVKNAAIVRQF
jgi:folate-dependent phosphoribosylglycinamide formyltransferase PurN